MKVIDSQKNDKLLERFFCDYIEFLVNEHIEYCVVGNYHSLPSYTENDIDIWVGDTSKAQLLLDKCARKHMLSLYLRNDTANGSNNYFYNETDNSLSIIKIDLMHECAFKSILPIMERDVFLENRSVYKQFNVLNQLHETYLHLMYPLIEFGIVKEKYKDKILQYRDNRQFQELIKENLDEQLVKLLITHLNNEDWQSIVKLKNKIRINLTKRMFLNLSGRRVSIFLNLSRSIFNRLFIYKNGVVVCLTGLDGAGKSTIVGRLLDESNHYFIKNKSSKFYWRPFLLPKISDIVGKDSGEKILASGRRSLKMSSNYKIVYLVKYLYYILDFIFGYFKYAKNSKTGGMILFDRYHFDNIIYPERFGFYASKKLMRIFDKIIPQPDVKIYLTASDITLYERKREIDLDIINEQKKMYSDEISKAKNFQEISTDQTVDIAYREVLLSILREMESRYKK